MPVPIGVFPSKKAAMMFWKRLKTLPDGPLPPNDDAKARSVLASRPWDSNDLAEGILCMWESEVANGERSLWLWFAREEKRAYQVSPSRTPFQSEVRPRSRSCRRSGAPLMSRLKPHRQLGAGG